MNNDVIERLIAGFVLWMKENHATMICPSDVLVSGEPEYNGKGCYFVWHPFKSEGRTTNDLGAARNYAVCTVSPNVIFEIGADGQFHVTHRTIGDNYRYGCRTKWGHAVTYTVPAGWWIITAPNLVEWRSSLKDAISKLEDWMNL